MQVIKCKREIKTIIKKLTQKTHQSNHALLLWSAIPGLSESHFPLWVCLSLSHSVAKQPATQIHQTTLFTSDYYIQGYSSLKFIMYLTFDIHMYKSEEHISTLQSWFIPHNFLTPEATNTVKKIIQLSELKESVLLVQLDRSWQSSISLSIPHHLSVHGPLHAASLSCYQAFLITSVTALLTSGIAHSSI